eukprot:GFYU01004745.1.p1 GENE.GFYU01004745.1~~GFYU01004745.1.p1  ORF type:complete len:1133 (-),score=265.34 GFYU01004745.1:7-3405(-)
MMDSEPQLTVAGSDRGSRRGRKVVTRSLWYATILCVLACFQLVMVVNGEFSITYKSVIEDYSKATLRWAEKQSHVGLLDLCFVIDTTGSMGGSIYTVQRQVESLIKELQHSPLAKKQKLRMGLVEYKDYSDDPITKHTNLSYNFDKLLKHVSKLSADGGNENLPEDMSDGLRDAVTQDWRREAVKMIILIADQPPHGVVDPYHSLLKWQIPLESLKEMGVIIHGVDCSWGDSGLGAVMVEMTQETGGFTASLRNFDLLPPMIKAVADEGLDRQRITQLVLDAVLQNKETLEPLMAEQVSWDSAIQWLTERLKDGNHRPRSARLVGSTVYQQFRDPQPRDVKMSLKELSRQTPDRNPCLQTGLFCDGAGIDLDTPKPSGLVVIPVAGTPANDTHNTLPLQSVSASVNVLDDVMSVDVEQVFRNVKDAVIQAEYTFPLPYEAAVTDFEARMEDAVVTGVVKAKAEARRVYHEAVSRGQKAFLLEESLPGLFKVRVGNLAPGAVVTIRLVYVSPLPEIAPGTYRVRLPYQIAPRFINHPPPFTDMSKTYSYEAAQEIDAPVHINVVAKMSSVINSVEVVKGPSGTLSIHSRSAKGEIQTTTLPGDVVIEIAVDSSKKDAIWIEEPGLVPADANSTLLTEEVAVAVKIHPDVTKYKTNPTSLTIAIDISSSVAKNGGLDEVVTALHRLLDEIPTKAGIQVMAIAFANGFSRSSSHHVTYTKEVNDDIVKWANSLEGYGGSRLDLAIHQMMTPPEGSKNHHVFLITDGYIIESESREAVEAAYAEDGVRLHIIGVGPSPNVRTLRYMATWTRTIPVIGTSVDFIQRQYKRSTYPNVQAKAWLATHNQEIPVDLVPHNFPTIFDGSEITFYALVPTYTDLLSTTFHLEASVPHHEWSQQWSVAANKYRVVEAGERPTLHRVAAFEQVLLLEAVMAEDIEEDLRARIVDEITLIGESYSIATTQTSFIAVESRTAPEPVLERATSRHGGVDGTIETEDFDDFEDRRILWQDFDDVSDEEEEGEEGAEVIEKSAHSTGFVHLRERTATIKEEEESKSKSHKSTKSSKKHKKIKSKKSKHSSKKSKKSTSGWTSRVKTDDDSTSLDFHVRHPDSGASTSDAVSILFVVTAAIVSLALTFMP